MLITRPVMLLIVAIVVLGANLTPSQVGGLRQPLAGRLAKPSTCDQQVGQVMEFGVPRRAGTKRRPRC